jgi:co-chaperonin GroES (HSP10)
MIEQEDVSSPYTLLRDYYLVLVDDLWENGKTKSGIITVNTAYHSKNNAADETEDRGEFKRRYGKIISIPMEFSDDFMIDLIEPPSPQSRRYVNHAHIQKMNLRQERGYRDHEDPRRHYYPSTFEKYDFVSIRDVAKNNTVQVGDRAYFLPTATDVERYLGPYAGGHLFSVRADEIICTTKKSPIFVNHEHYVQTKITPQNDWVFAEIDMEDWEEITMKVGGVDMQVKVSPEAKPLRGKCVAGPTELVDKKILFEREADAPVTIDGRNLTCMRLGDVLATLKS